MNVNAAKLTGRLEKILDPEGDLRDWSIVRSGCEVKITRTYRSGVTLSTVVPLSDPEFINASL